MAKKRANEVAVGLTVLVVLALTVYIVVALGNWKDWLIPKQKITVLLPYEKGLKGLTKGSPVYLGGAKIGTIIEADIRDPNANGEIFAYFVMEIPKKYEVYNNCKLMAESNVLGGQASLAIEYLGSQEAGGILLNPEKKDHDTLILEDMKGGVEEIVDSIRKQLNEKDPDSLMSTIKHELSHEPDTIVSSLTEALKGYTEVAAKINYQLDPNEQKALVVKILQVFDNLVHISEGVKEQLNEKNKKALLAKLHKGIDNLVDTSGELKAQMDKDNKEALLFKLLNTLDELRQSNQKIQSLLRSTDGPKPLSNVEVILADLDEAIRQINLLIKHQYPNIDLAIRNVVEGSENFKEGIEDLKKQPGKLIYSMPPPKSETVK